MRMSNLIPITKIYDIYPKYTFSKDVMRFMDDIVDIPRAEVFTKDEVIAILKNLQQDILGHQRFQSADSWTRVVKTTDVEIEIDKAIDELER